MKRIFKYIKSLFKKNNKEIDLELCYNLVLDFHTKFRFKKQTKEQRFGIWYEEYMEWNTATNDIDKLDGLVDMFYVSLGTLINDGRKPTKKDLTWYANNNTFSDFNGAFREVHRSNMSKACKDLETVYKTIAGRENMTYEKVDGMYFVKDENMKLIKSVDYSKANLEPYI